MTVGIGVDVAVGAEVGIGVDDGTVVSTSTVWGVGVAVGTGVRVAIGVAVGLGACPQSDGGAVVSQGSNRTSPCTASPLPAPIPLGPSAAPHHVLRASICVLL